MSSLFDEIEEEEEPIVVESKSETPRARPKPVPKKLKKDHILTFNEFIVWLKKNKDKFVDSEYILDRALSTRGHSEIRKTFDMAVLFVKES